MKILRLLKKIPLPILFIFLGNYNGTSDDHLIYCIEF